MANPKPRFRVPESRPQRCEPSNIGDARQCWRRQKHAPTLADKAPAYSRSDGRRGCPQSLERTLVRCQKQPAGPVQGSLGRGCYPSPRRQPILTEIDAHDSGGGSCLNRPDYDTAAGLQGHPFSATAIRGVYVRLRRTRSHAHVLLLTRSRVPAIAAGPPWLTTAPFQDTVTNKHTLVWRQKKASDGPEAQMRAVANRGRWVSNPQRP